MTFVLNEYHRDVSDEELLKDIRRVATGIEKTTLTQDEYRKNGGDFHPSTYAKRFGGWIQALQKCGLSPNRSQTLPLGVDSNELIGDLQNVARNIGNSTFTTSEYLQNGKYSKSLYLRRFGSWNNALVSAGLQPFDHPLGGGSKNKISEYSCFEEIERIWITLGRQPTTTDVKNGASKYSLHVYERRFGSWRKALECFVTYMNDEEEVERPEESEKIQLPQITVEENEADDSGHKTKGDIGLRLRFMVMKRDNFKCCMCGRSPATTPGLELHIDHIIPWSKGGETTFDNLQTLCSDCNLGKSNLSEIE